MEEAEPSRSKRPWGPTKSFLREKRWRKVERGEEEREKLSSAV